MYKKLYRSGDNEGSSWYNTYFLSTGAQKQKPSKRSEQEEKPIIEGKDIRAKGQELTGRIDDVIDKIDEVLENKDMDKLMEDIDRVLEEEGLVEKYVQKGGQ